MSRIIDLILLAGASICAILGLLTAADVVEWSAPRTECVGPWLGPHICHEVWGVAPAPRVWIPLPSPPDEMPRLPLDTGPVRPLQPYVYFDGHSFGIGIMLPEPELPYCARWREWVAGQEQRCL